MEIKFRAWDKENKKMLYDIDNISKRYTLNEILSMECYGWMLYTGLKDKNGKEIYDGDILKGDGYLLPSLYFIIKFGRHNNYDKCFYFANQKTGGYPLNYEYTANVEIEGNIYENPELWEECREE